MDRLPDLPLGPAQKPTTKPSDGLLTTWYRHKPLSSRVAPLSAQQVKCRVENRISKPIIAPNATEKSKEPDKDEYSNLPENNSCQRPNTQLRGYPYKTSRPGPGRHRHYSRVQLRHPEAVHRPGRFFCLDACSSSSGCALKPLFGSQHFLGEGEETEWSIKKNLDVSPSTSVSGAGRVGSESVTCKEEPDSALTNCTGQSPLLTLAWHCLH